MTLKVFVGYVYRRPEKINFGLYTHLCHAFVVADEAGVIRPNRSCPSKELVADAHAASVRVLLSLGGWGWTSSLLRSSANRKLRIAM